MKSILFAVLLFTHCLYGQDKVTKTNNEEVVGKIIRFDNGKFTLLLADNAELTFAKDGIKSIAFDTAKCATSTAVSLAKEVDMDPNCEKSSIGNCIFINKTGEEVTLRVYKQGFQNDFREFKLSKSEDPVKFYGFESGSYGWYTVFGLQTSGGFFVPKCQTAKPVVIK